MNIAGKAVEREEEPDGHSRERSVGPANPTQSFANQPSSTRYRISALFSLLVLPTARAASEAAPSEGWDDFANNLGSDLAPLLALFGEQVTTQYLSEALSLLDCLLFALAPLGIITAMVSAIRVAGSPLLRSLVGRAKESRGSVEADLMSSTSADVCELWNGEGVVRVLGRPVLLQLVCFNGNEAGGDGSTGIYTFRDAVKRGLYHAQRRGGSAGVHLATSPGTHVDVEDLRALEKPPNLSLNVSVRPLDRRVLMGFVSFGVVLQAGVLAYAAVAQYKLKLQKNDKAPVAYGIYVLVAGTLSLAAGIFGCAMVVERSTTELEWMPVKKETSKLVIWLQQGGQTVGDQRFESFARIIHGQDNKILSSHKSAKAAVDTEDDEETDTNAPATQTFGTPVLVTVAVTTAFIGFIMQFLGLRVMHSSVTIAQLGAILIMTALRSCAYIQRESRNDIKNPDQVEGHELDWLAENLTDCQEWQVIAKPREGEGAPHAIDFAVAAIRVMKTRARLAMLSEDWKLDIRVTADALQVVVESTINDVFAKMTMAPGVKDILEWNIPVMARLKGRRVIEFGKVTLELKRSKDENSNWRAWGIEKSDLEAVLSLWVFSIAKLGRKRERMGKPRLKQVWLLDLATEEAIINHRLWIHRGTTPKSTPLDPETLYFGWTETGDVNSGSDPAGIPEKYLVVEREGPIVSACAESLYTSFLFNLASQITDVGGVTARRTEESTAGGSSADHWSQFRLNNSNLASLAVIYNESFLGTVEEAYFSIIPAFCAAKRLPHPHEAYQEARAVSATLSKRRHWEKAIEIDSWLYNNSKKTGFSPPDYAVMAAEIIRRLRALTEVLLTRCLARGKKMDEKLSRLWNTAYTFFRMTTESSVNRAACAMNLYISHDIVKSIFNEEVEELYHLAENYLVSLPVKKEERSDILSKVFSVRRGSLFPCHEIEVYLSDPASLQLAAKTTVDTYYNTLQRVPKELILVQGFRTLLQWASEIGHAGIVQKLLTAGADIEALPGQFHGRTALQAAAGAGHKHVVKLLLSTQANVNAGPGQCYGRTALQAAAGAGHKDIVELLQKVGAEVDAQPGQCHGRTALQAAAEGGSGDIVELLLLMEAEVNAKPGIDHGRTALQAAAGGGHEDIIKLLLSMQGEVNAKPGINHGRTVLQAAAEGGHEDIIELLLSMQAEVNADPGINYGRTALQAAAGGGHKDVVELLLLARAEVNANPGINHGRTALQAAAEGGNDDIVELLLSAQAEVNANPGVDHGKTALQAASASGDMDVVNKLLAKGADVNTILPSGSALQAAAASGYINVVNELLAKGANVNTMLWKGSALQAAAGGGHLAVVDRFLEEGADVNAEPSEYSSTALQAAAKGGYLAVVDRLLEKGAHVNDMWPGGSALQAAAGAGHLAVVDRFLEKGADVNYISQRGSALQAAAGGGHLIVVDRLLEKGANVNAPPSKYSRTALQAAAGGGHLDVVDRLLEMGDDVNDEPSVSYGRTALQAAAGGGHLAVVDRLLEKGADANAEPLVSYGRTALQAAAGGGHLPVVNRLLEKGADVNADQSDSYGRTALQAAAGGGHLAVLDRLLEQGASVNAPPSKHGRTALQAAAGGGHLAVVDRLLEKRADVNAKPSVSSGRTALQAAARGGHLDVVDRLLKKRADVNAEPSFHSGRTALQAAARGGHLDVVERLLEKGAHDTGRKAFNEATRGGHLDIVDRLLGKRISVTSGGVLDGATIGGYQDQLHGEGTAVTDNEALEEAKGGVHMDILGPLRKTRRGKRPIK